MYSSVCKLKNQNCHNWFCVRIHNRPFRRTISKCVHVGQIRQTTIPLAIRGSQGSDLRQRQDIFPKFRFEIACVIFLCCSHRSLWEHQDIKLQEYNLLRLLVVQNTAVKENSEARKSVHFCATRNGTDPFTLTWPIPLRANPAISDTQRKLLHPEQIRAFTLFFCNTSPAFATIWWIRPIPTLHE